MGLALRVAKTTFNDESKDDQADKNDHSENSSVLSQESLDEHHEHKRFSLLARFSKWRRRRKKKKLRKIRRNQAILYDDGKFFYHKIFLLIINFYLIFQVGLNLGKRRRKPVEPRRIENAV